METQANPSSKNSSALGLIIFLAVMATANIWLWRSTFPQPQEGGLPKPNLGLFQASSFIITNSQTNETEPIEPLNILVLGRSGGNYIAPNLTDTILVARVDTVVKKIKIVSIPRDLAVKIPESKNIIKINGMYQLGLNQSEQEGLRLIKEKVEEVTGLKIDRFALFDLATVESVIDTIGGVNVLVKDDIYDTRFPASSGGYETFTLKNGYRYLDGQTALRFIRTRHSPRGDFDRIERQQGVLKAIKGKLISFNPIWDFSKLWAIYKAVKENVRTDLSLSDFKNVWSLAKNIDIEKIETMGLNPENGLIAEDKIKLGVHAADILLAKNKPFDYTDIKSAIDNFINDANIRMYSNDTNK
ncbi:MAG: LCP family protein [Patescibacteria group bacterium]